jgi:threonine synthase
MFHPEASFKCLACENKFDLQLLYYCPDCGGHLDVIYENMKAISNTFASKQFRKGMSVWDFQELLPVQTETPVTLGEGGSPLLQLKKSGGHLQLPNLFLKNDSVQPTGAFKDRPLSVAATFAAEADVKGIITASTGNTGVAASAYSARSGSYCRIYVPASASEEKLKIMKLFGADLRPLEMDFSEAYNLVKQVAEEEDLYNVTSTFINPIAIEGDKTVAYELWYQMKGKVPDWIFVPIGAGPLLVAIEKAYRELYVMGLVNKIPKMAGVQAEAVSPIVEAYKQGWKQVKPWLHGTATKAGGIADPLSHYPEDGTRTLEAIRRSGGMAAAVSEEELTAERKRLAQEEGILLEISAASAVAAVKQVRPKMNDNDIVICIGTGHGLKDLSIS